MNVKEYHYAYYYRVYDQKEEEMSDSKFYYGTLQGAISKAKTLARENEKKFWTIRGGFGKLLETNNGVKL